MPKISVIVPIYNALDKVKLLLESLNINFDFKIGEVILINDCSDAETSNFLMDFSNIHSQYSLITNEENLGFVKTCNKGMKIAKGEIIILLNSDTIIPSQFCERVIKCFEKNKKAGIASPIASFSGTYCIELPKDYTLEKMNELLREKHKCSYPLIPNAEGFCFCIRKEVIEKQGYLDEVYGKGYHEEIDFAYRAITNGWKNVLIDDLYIFHAKHASFGTQQRESLIVQNNLTFFQRWDGFREDYIINNNLKNPIAQITWDLFKIKINNNYDDVTNISFWQQIFSIKNRGTHKVIRLLGFKIKFKRKNKK